MKIKKKVWVAFLVLFLCWSTVGVFANGTHTASEEQSTDQTTSTRPDSHATIGVMGDHAHSAGELMLSYRFMGMAMEGLLDRNATVATEDALLRYQMVPTTMQMQMHNFGAMFAPHDSVTLMAMTSYRSNLMEMEGAHTHTTGGHDHPIGHQEIESAGLGDLRLSALIPLLNASNADLILNAGISIPTGAIDVEGTHGGDELVVLPYPMQLGSGSFELRPAVTFAGTGRSWSYSAQARAAIPLNENSRNYRLAPTVGSTLWGARKLNDWLSISVRGSIENRGNITTSTEQIEMEASADEHDHAADHSHAAPAAPAQTHYMSPTMDPNLQGGTRVNLAAGVNFIVPDRFGSILAGQRLAVEFQMPVYQNLDGPQMALGWTIVAGWQYAFGVW
ncbi:transporter [Candidatus Poribacteria bacterium]|nr:transporter [Candidatus Poribacteria bacterium]